MATAFSNVLRQFTDEAGTPVGHGYTVTHYVSADGSASWGAATNPSTPCSLATMLSNVAAGNVVEFAPGVYSVAGSGTGSGNPAFSFPQGSVGSPITYTAKYPAAYNDAEYRSKFRDTNQPGSGSLANRPVMRINGNTIVDGLWFDDTDGAKPHSRGVIYNAFETSNNYFRRCRFDRTAADQYGSGRDNDNYNSIHMHGNSNIRVQDCRFIGGRTTGISPNRNYAHITIYGTLNYLIEHCLFQDSESGIFQKGSGGSADPGSDGVRGNQGVIRFNRLVNIQRGIMLGEQEDEGTATECYQNLVYSTTTLYSPICEVEFDNSVGPKNFNNWLYNNTIIMHPSSGAGGIYSENNNNHTNNRVRNNIVACFASNSQVLVNFFENPVPTVMSAFDHNMYYNNGATPTFAVNSAVQTGLAAWKSAMDPLEANSQAANPLFEDVGAFDFRLQSGSPALTASHTGGPVGCYITGSEEIGVRANPSY